MPLATDLSSEQRADVSDAHALRIVYVWDADYPWDVRTEKTCATLTEFGHNVHIVARNRAQAPVREQLPEATVHRMKPWRWAGRRLDGALGFPAFFSPRWYAHIAGVVRDVGADLVIGRDLPLAPTSIMVARRFGIPVVCDMAEHYPGMMRAIWESGRARPIDYVVRNPKVVEAVERWTLAHLDRVMVVVDEAADALAARGVPRDRIDVVSNTPPAARAREATHRPPKPAGAPIDIVYLGILEIPRGVLELIEAMALLRDATPRVRLRVIGRGRDAEIFRARAAELGLGPDIVEFMGFIESRDEALRLVREADIGAVPQRANEASDFIIPNKLFDYMAVGLPVLSADSAPCARVVRTTGAGEVFRTADAPSAAAAIRRLLDAETRRRCGEAGRRAVLEQFNWEHDTQALLASVERATRGAAARPSSSARSDRWG